MLCTALWLDIVIVIVVIICYCYHQCHPHYSSSDCNWFVFIHVTGITWLSICELGAGCAWTKSATWWKMKKMRWLRQRDKTRMLRRQLQTPRLASAHCQSTKYILFHSQPHLHFAFCHEWQNAATTYVGDNDVMHNLVSLCIRVLRLDCSNRP